MRTRIVCLHHLEQDYQLEVPERVQRLSSASLKGWQLRWGAQSSTQYFADSKFGGPVASLLEACKALKAFLAGAPIDRAAYLIPTVPQRNKTDKTLPVGVSGPVTRLRRGAVSFYWNYAYPVLDVSTGKATFKRGNVYISSQNTYTSAKEKQALAKAVSNREVGINKYRTARATLDKRQQRQDLDTLKNLMIQLKEQL